MWAINVTPHTDIWRSQGRLRAAPEVAGVPLSLIREVWFLTEDITTAVLDSPEIGQCEDRLYAVTEVELKSLLDRKDNPPLGAGYIGSTGGQFCHLFQCRFEIIVLTKEPVTQNGLDDTVTPILAQLQEGQGVLVNDVRTGCCYEDGARMVALGNGVVAKPIAKGWVRIWRDAKTSIRAMKRNNRVVQRKDNDSKGVIQDFAEFRECVNDLSLRVDRAGEYCLRAGFSDLVAVPRRTLSSEGWTAHRRPSLIREIRHMQTWFKCSPRLCPGLLKAVASGEGNDHSFWYARAVDPVNKLFANKKRFLAVAQRIEGAGKPLSAEWGWLFRLVSKVRALQTE